MNMTHYMELLATNQPWNLLLFMAVPVVLAETVAITELYLLATRAYDGIIRKINRAAGIVVGIYFIGVFVHLVQNAVVPLTATGGWRGWIDVLAVGAYLLGVVPLGGIALLDLGLIARGRDAHARMMIHAGLVGLFLAVAHVAMIFGMLDPTLGTDSAAMTDMPHSGHMMSH